MAPSALSRIYGIPCLRTCAVNNQVGLHSFRDSASTGLRTYGQTVNLAGSMDDHRIPFGLDAAGKPVSIVEAKRGLACGCFCAACGGELVANQGEIKVWYFSHKSKAECFGALESALHIAVKTLIENRKSLRIPPCIVHSHLDAAAAIAAKKTGGGGVTAWGQYLYVNSPIAHTARRSLSIGEGQHPDEPTTLVFDSVEVEAWEGCLRPDIVGIVKGRKIYIEVAVTHFVDRVKLARLRERNTPTIELVVPFAHQQQWDWVSLENWLLKESTSKNWLLNPRVERLADEARERQVVAFEQSERIRLEKEARAAERLQRAKDRAVEERVQNEQKRLSEQAAINAEYDRQAALAAAKLPERQAADKLARETLRAQFAKEDAARRAKWIHLDKAKSSNQSIDEESISSPVPIVRLKPDR